MKKAVTGKPRVCGCGHEDTRHALVDVGEGVQKHIGACSHNCRCTGFHRRRRGSRSTTITDPGALLSASMPVVVGPLPPLPMPTLKPFESRVAKAFDELRDAVLEALKPTPIEVARKPEGAPWAGLVDDVRRRVRNRIAENATPSNSGLPKGELAILTAVAQHPDGCDRPQLTALTAYKASTRNAYIQRLFEKRLLAEEDGIANIHATREGLALLGPSFKKLPTGDKLRELLLESLPEGESLVLDLVARSYPTPVVRDAISVSTGYKPSTRNAYIQRLEKKKLVLLPTRDSVVASPHLFTKKARRA